MAKTTLALVLLVLMGGAWWWALTRALVRPAPSSAPVAAASRAAGEKAPTVALDRLRRVPPVPARTDGRDPFAGGAAARRGDDLGGRAGVAVPVADEAVAAVPQWPRIELIGVGTQQRDGATVRVAVLAGDRGVVHAVPGDEVLEVYRVMRVEADAVEVELVPEARVFTLALR